MELNPAPARGLDARSIPIDRDCLPLDVASLPLDEPVLVVIPHPDDESLGCGGLLALLGDAGAELHLLLVTDGTASHPRSRRFDADARRALRDGEWRLAVARLGLDDARLHRLHCTDGDTPRAGDPHWSATLGDVCAIVEAIRPGLVVLPWRRDPHVDHRASHALVAAALAGRPGRPRCLEYPVWAFERGDPADWPSDDEAVAWRLDIAAVRGRKRRAIAAHRSQLGEVIDDDPGGFTLAPAMRERAEGPIEHYLEVRERS